MYKYTILVLILVLFAAGCAANPEKEYSVTQLGAESRAPEDARAIVNAVASESDTDKEMESPLPIDAADGTDVGETSSSSDEAAPMLEKTEEENDSEKRVVGPVTVDPGESTPEPDKAGEIVVVPAPGTSNRTIKLVQDVSIDLSDRLDIDTSEVRVVEIEEVVWSDSSLGCPIPGMNYLMVLTSGYQIILEAQGQQYAYHTRDTSHFVLCDGVGQLKGAPNPNE